MSKFFFIRFLELILAFRPLWASYFIFTRVKKSNQKKARPHASPSGSRRCSASLNGIKDQYQNQRHIVGAPSRRDFCWKRIAPRRALESRCHTGEFTTPGSDWSAQSSRRPTHQGGFSLVR